MSASDIENVLSSIRRLVTEDLRPRAATTEPEPAAPPPVQDKLLLTPALRVVGRAEDSAPRPPIDGVLSLIGARVAPPATGFEAETGDAFDAAMEKAPPRPVAAFTQPAPAVASAMPGVAAPAVALDPGPHVAGNDDLGDADDVETADAATQPVVDLDEEMLRELIRDVLREELQGPMGERITRNIRKLVRAELAQSVAMRNID